MRHALAVNGAFLLAAFVAQSEGWPASLRMLAAAGLVLGLPGVAWLPSFRVLMTPARAALAGVGISVASAIAGCAVCAALPGPPSARAFLVWTFLAINAGVVLSRRAVDFELGARWGVLAAVFTLGFLATATVGLRLVPPLEDHDMEVRGTAYGLLTEGRPYFTSNREVYLPMSHPLGFNVVVAGSLLVTGEIDAVRPSYDSAKRAELAVKAGQAFPWEQQWKEDYEAFLARPALIGTRAPSAFLAGLVLALLVDLVRRTSGSLLAGLAAAGIYATVPETIVRDAYAGYFVETVFAMLVAAMIFVEVSPAPGVNRVVESVQLLRAGDLRAAGALARDWLRPPYDVPAPVWLVGAGALMAVLDHKTVLLVLAIAGWYGGRALIARSRPDPRVVALVLGFCAATLAWWTYGLWVDASVFVADHLRRHIAHRILLNDVRFVRDTVNHYAPSIPELWREFAAHTGYGIPLVGLCASVAALVRRIDERRVILALWVMSTAIAFTLVDWRQTKHLMNGLLPMVALAVIVAARPGRLRWFAVGALAAGTAVNLAADLRLFADFASFTVSGASDVDGW